MTRIFTPKDMFSLHLIWHRPWAQRWLLAAVLGLVGAFVFRQELIFLRQADPPFDEVVEDFYQGHVRAAGAVEKNEGFLAGPYGWYLPPGTRGELIYQVDLPEAATRWVRLSVGVNLSSAYPGRVEISTNGTEFETILHNRSARHVGEYFDIGHLVEGHRHFWIRVTAASPDEALSQELVWQALIVRSFATPPPIVPPAAKIALLVGWFAGAATLFWKEGFRFLPVVGLVASAAYGRWIQFAQMMLGRTEPDAGAYRTYIDSFDWSFFGRFGFYSGNFSEREPFFLAVSKLFFEVLGSSDTHLRLVSLVLSLLGIVVMYAVAAAMFRSRWAGWIGAAGLAWNVPLIAESVRGLRLELEIVLLLMFVAALTLWRGFHGRRFVILGILGGFLGLTRFNYAVSAIALILFVAFWQGRRVGWKRMLRLGLVGSALVVIMVAPHKWGIYRIHGDPNWDVKHVTRWWVNVEFAGQPGFPSAESVGGDAYQGELRSFSEYVFGMHPFNEVVRSVVRGYVAVVRNLDIVGKDYLLGYAGRVPIALGIDVVFELLVIAGMAIAIWQREKVELVVVWIVFLMGSIFPYSRGLLEQYRHTYAVFPIGILLALLALWTFKRRWLEGLSIELKKGSWHKRLRW